MIRRGLALTLAVVLFSVVCGAQAEFWQTGKVVAVEKQEPEIACCYSGTDTPLQSNVNIYDVSLQIGDMLYVGRYETYFDYVPTNWAKDRLVPARAAKHLIYLRTPSGEEMRLSLLSRRRTDETPKTH